MAAATQDLALELSKDSLGFVRRACPQCSRHFKVNAKPSESLVVQAAFLALVQHGNAEEVDGVPSRFCPYCGYQAAGDAFLTPAQREYIGACAKAVSNAVRYEQLRVVETRLSQNPYITFLPVKPVDPVPALPPEPDDMQPETLRCCGDELKLKANWEHAFFCHHCRARQSADGR